MKIAMIVAMGENRGIGKDGNMPWHMPADLKHFKQLTMGKPIIMGRKTYESIGKALSGRTNIVITRDASYPAEEGVIVVNNYRDALDAALKAENPSREIMVIGGGTIYAAFLPHAKRLYITEIKSRFDADTHFPPLEFGWMEVSREDHPADERNPVPYSFVVLEKP